MAESSTAKASIQAAQASFIPAMQQIVRAYQALTGYSAQHLRSVDLTPPQFEVISALGNTSGMSMHKLGEKTLITKGTLTGVIDRLEQKGLVQREVPEGNRRSFIVSLTPNGTAVFEAVFPAHMDYLKERFDRLDPDQLAQLKTNLELLCAALN